MKKSLLTIALIGSVAVVAQQPTVLTKSNLKNKAVPVKNLEMSFYDAAAAASSPQRNHSNPPMTLATETVVGQTTYPLQTNRSTMNRVMRNGDGTVSISYTFSNGAFNSWADRGTGYNFFDGTNWAFTTFPTNRIETDRTGFGEVHVLGGNSELSCAHNTNQSNAQHFCSRPVKGTGAWTESYTAQPAPANFTYGTLWPRMAVSGSSGNIMHHIALTTPSTASPAGAPFHGQDGALVYSRSTDGGVTWSVPNVISLIDSSQYINWAGDAYSIDAKGSTVAIVIGDLTADVVLLKSTDDGVNWTKTIVKQFPIPLYNGGLTDINSDNIADTLESSDQSYEVLVDNNGMAHVWYGYMETINPDGSPDSVYYFPGLFGIMYWNEGMGSTPPQNIAGPLDYNANSQLDVTAYGSYYTGLTSHPSAGIDAAGNLYMAYSSIIESTDNGSGKSYRVIYVISSSDGGATWTNPYQHLTGLDPNNFDFYERVYPSVGRNVTNNMIGLLYQRDAQPGHGVGTSNPDASENSGGINELVYVEIPTSDLIGITEQSSNLSDVSLYPNPASNNAVLNVNINKGDAYTVEISNLLGQSMISSKHQMGAGNNTVNLNTSALAPGVYFVTVANSESKISTKLVIE
ncbi:MAG: subtilisin-like serine protease [Bacteroidetes bacterium]|nr:MAG: subtilisin-like serine protease [Bacteroidota bacterium]